MFILTSKFIISDEESDWSYDQVLWTLGFSVILVTAILGNTSVLWIITGDVYLRFVEGVTK